MNFLVFATSSRAVQQFFVIVGEGCKADIIVTPEQAECLNLSKFNNIYRLLSDKFEWEAFTEEIAINLQNTSYDKKFILCNDIYEKNYRSVEQFANEVSSAPTYFLDEQGNMKNWDCNIDKIDPPENYATSPEKEFVKTREIEGYQYEGQYTELFAFFEQKIKNNQVKNKFFSKGDSPKDIIRILGNHRQKYQELMGNIPGDRVSIDNIEKRVFEKKETATVYRVSYPSRFEGLKVEGLLGIPGNLKNPVPAVVAVHGYSSSPDKVMGYGEKDYCNFFGKKLLNNGFVVIAPFITNHGDIAENLQAMATCNRISLRIFDIARIMASIDILEQSPQVNEDAIGYYGISAGALVGLRVGVYDQRVLAKVINGYINDRYKYLRDYPAELRKMRGTNYMWPEVMNGLNYTPADIGIMNYPGKILFENGRRDKNKIEYEDEKEFEKIKQFYKQMGAEEEVMFHRHDGYHEIYDDHGIEFLVNELMP